VTVGLERRLPGAFAVLALCAALLAAGVSHNPPAVIGDGAGAPAKPLSFIPNRGQTDARVRYYAQASGFGAYFTRHGVTLDLHKGSKAAALRLRFPGAEPTAVRRAPGTVSYFVGHRRFSNIPTYSELRYHEVWPGIDVSFRSQGGRLKYEFLVAPGADPTRIRMSYSGASSLAVDRTGALTVGTPVGPLRDGRPVTRQGGRMISSTYAVSGTAYGFALGAYDRSRPLVIDPGLVWSTFIGGTNDDQPVAVATDAAGAAYMAGEVSSLDYPTTPGAYDPSPKRMFVSKFSPAGALVYSTYFGGTGDPDPNLGGNFDYLNDIAVDPTGHAYITGATNSTDFPTTPGAYKAEPTSHQIERFVTKLNTTGTGLDYSTVIGNLDTYYYVGSIAVDSAGSAYVAANTVAANYPTTPGAYETTPPASGSFSYLTKLDTTGTSLVYSTLLHGSNATQVAVDTAGSAYLAGDGYSTLPTTPGAYDPSWNGNSDAFVTKFNASGSALVYSTFVGGSDSDYARGLVVDGSGSAYMTGATSGRGFPTTPGAFDSTAQAGDAFVTKLNPAGSGLAYSTLLGGSGAEFASGIAVDGAGQAAATGFTDSSDFPIASSSPVDTSFNGSRDVYATVVNATGTGLIYSTYLGGSLLDQGTGTAFDGQGNMYVTGHTGSPEFPTTPGAYDTTHNSSPSPDGFLTKIGIPAADAYVRPKGATPMRVSLVTANQPCADPTVTHGSPLAYPSCAGPVLSSSFLTVGTGDSNARPALMQASIRMDVQPGNPATPADEADVRLQLHANDVFNKDLTDYAGELRGLVNLRITDKDSAAPAGNGTTIDFPFGFTAGCAADPDPQIGSLCDVTTTVDAVTPGAVKESQRAIWALDKVRVFDGGPDGDADTAAGNTLFLTQGVFVP
jgi:Beta-propeller repeat